MMLIDEYLEKQAYDEGCLEKLAAVGEHYLEKLAALYEAGYELDDGELDLLDEYFEKSDDEIGLLDENFDFEKIAVSEGVHQYYKDNRNSPHVQALRQERARDLMAVRRGQTNFSPDFLRRNGLHQQYGSDFIGSSERYGTSHRGAINDKMMADRINKNIISEKYKSTPLGKQIQGTISKADSLTSKMDGMLRELQS